MRRGTTIAAVAVAVSLLPLAGAASAQDRFNRVVEKRYPKSGQLSVKGEIRNGERHGLWTYWYENGQIREKLEYEDGIIVGKWTKWHENGQMAKEAECLQLDTLALTRKEHRKLSRRYGDGTSNVCARIGEWTEWYDNGRWESKRQYRNGRPHGRHVSWCPNGQPKSQTDYVDGGSVVHFYPAVNRRVEYRSDAPEEWAANSKRFSGYSIDCKRFGEWEEYYLNGQKAVEGEYHDGKRVGEWTLYHPNGQVATKGRFSGWNELEELMCRGTCWDENGKMVNCGIEYAESTSCRLFVSTGTWVRQ